MFRNVFYFVASQLTMFDSLAQRRFSKITLGNLWNIADASFKKEKVFFYVAFCYPTASFEPLLRGQHLLKHCSCLFKYTEFIQVQTKGHQRSYNEFGSLRPTKRLVEFKTRTFQFICSILSLKPRSWGFQVNLIDICIVLDFLVNRLLYFQMKPKLLILIYIFNLSSSRHKSVMRVRIWQKKPSSSSTVTYLSRWVCFERFAT